MGGEKKKKKKRKHSRRRNLAFWIVNSDSERTPISVNSSVAGVFQTTRNKEKSRFESKGQEQIGETGGIDEFAGVSSQK